MTKRATRRPKPFAKPAHWDDSPAPSPVSAESAESAEDDPDGLDPTRYGDWVKNGLAVDF
jgi:hypothetical protein